VCLQTSGIRCPSQQHQARDNQRLRLSGSEEAHDCSLCGLAMAQFRYGELLLNVLRWSVYGIGFGVCAFITVIVLGLLIFGIMGLLGY